MGFHATITAGQDAFGNMRHKTAPRVKASERVTGTAQQDKARRLAGPVVTFPGIPGVTHDEVSQTTLKLASYLAGRKVTALTERWTDFRKVSATRFELTLRGIGGKVVVIKRNPTKTSDFKGWVALYVATDGTQVELTRVAKGDSIETNGERSDTCRKALTVLQLRLMHSA